MNYGAQLSLAGCVHGKPELFEVDFSSVALQVNASDLARACRHTFAVQQLYFTLKISLRRIDGKKQSIHGNIFRNHECKNRVFFCLRQIWLAAELAPN